MGRRPDNRRHDMFGDMAQNVTDRIDPAEADGDVYVGLEHLDPGSLRIRRWGTPADVIGQKLKFRRGDVIFGKRRAYQRKLAVAECDGICSAHAMVVRAKPKVVLPEFLPFLMQSDMFMERAVEISVGSLSPTINWKTLKVQEFPLPPLDEQRRIAAILWAADETTETWLSAGQRASALIDRLTAAFLAGESTPSQERRKTCYGMLPVEWEVVPCEKLFGSPPRNGWSAPANAEGRGYPTLSIGAVRDGRVIPDGNVKLVDANESEVSSYFLRPGDVLVVRGNGNRDLCGRCGVVTGVPKGCFYPDLLIRVAFDESRLIPEFAVLEWNSPTVHRSLLSRAKSTNGIWKVNGKDLRKHEFIVPPLGEQQAFMDMIAGPRAAAARIGDHLAKARNVRACLLNNLVGGQR